MTTLRKKVEQTIEVGFQCGMCHKNYKTTTCGEDWPYSSRGFIYYDPEDDMGDAITMDFCYKCWKQLRAIVKQLGGVFEDDNLA